MRICSDDEFIATWKAHNGEVEKVAKTLGLKIRGCYARRRKIEKNHRIILTAQKSALAAISDDRIEIKKSIEDGVVMVGGDAHYWPGVVPTMHRAFVMLCKKLKPVLVINNGDSFDGSTISRFPDIGHEEKPSVKQEIENLKDRLEEIVRATDGVPHVWNLGNHCMRYETRLASVASEYRGVSGFHLKDHFPRWMPAWFVTINEGDEAHTEIRHREKGGIHAGYNNVLHSGINIVCGHDHRAEAIRFDDRRGFRWSVRTGMMADDARNKQFANYLEGRKPNWQSAFAVLTYKGGRLLAPEHCWRVDDDTVEFRGTLLNV